RRRSPRNPLWRYLGRLLAQAGIPIRLVRLRANLQDAWCVQRVYSRTSARWSEATNSSASRESSPNSSPRVQPDQKVLFLRDPTRADPGWRAYDRSCLQEGLAISV